MPFTEDKPLLGEPDKDRKQYTTAVKALAHLGALLAMFLAATASACAQALGGVVPGFQRNVWRFLAQFLFVLPFVAIMKLDVRVERRFIPYLMVDCIAYSIFNWTFYGADLYLPTATVGCVEVTTVIVLTAAVSWIILKEYKSHLAVASLLCLTGVILVTQPEFVFKDVKPIIINPVCTTETESECSKDLRITNILGSNKSITKQGSDISVSQGIHINASSSGSMFNRTALCLQSDYRNSTRDESAIEGHESTLFLGYVYVVLSGASFVVFIFCTSRSLQDVHPYIISLWISVSGIAIGLIGMAIFETPTFPSSAVCVGLLAGNALTSGAVFLVNTPSLKVLSPQVYALLTTLQILFMCVAQYTVLKDVNNGRQNAFEIIGIVVVVFGNAVGPFYSLYLELKPKETDQCNDADFKLEIQQGDESSGGDAGRAKTGTNPQ